MMKIKRYAKMLSGCAALAALVLLALSGGTTGSAQRAGLTLHERAKGAGGRVAVLLEPERQSFAHDLEKLVRRSAAVVVGRPLSNRGTLSADGKSVTQDYRVKVQGVIKGNVTGGSTITISLPGGGYRFGDGALVSVRAKDYRQAENGKVYVFFLDAKESGYKLAGGTQGLFRLAADGKIEPASSSPADLLAAKYKGAETAAFLRELRRAAVARTR